MRDAAMAVMPDPDVILTQLQAMTHQLAGLAFAWHVVLALAVLALVVGWRPTQKNGVLLLAAPAVSAAMAAALYVNPFNAISFGVLALLIALASWFQPSLLATSGPPWSKLLGIALVAFGWGYPHFVGGAWTRSLYAAPVGVVPCATLAVIAGFALLAGSFGSRMLAAVLGLWTAFYAVVGVVGLGVHLDLGLGVAAVGLLALAVHSFLAHHVVRREAL